ncbi:MAG: hypothetical protein H3C34_27710, partial [Caldilineaceae bacterium]|nr:hypothetical protein [Caldilineaceae bacterium]
MRLLVQLCFLAALLGTALPATAYHARASMVAAQPPTLVPATELALQPLEDPAAVFRLSYPATFLVSPLPGDNDLSYGFNLSALDGSAQIRLAVTPAQRAWALSQGKSLPAGIDLTPLSDEQWRDVLQDLATALGAVQDVTGAMRPLSANFRSALVETVDPVGAPVSAWIEEIDGVLATLVLTRADGQTAPALRDAVLPSYAWSPARAIATLAGRQQATTQTVARTFRDPAGTFTLALPHFLTFTKMEATRAGRAYTFEDAGRDTRFTMRFTSLDEPPTDETWPDLAADILAGTLAQLRGAGEAAPNSSRGANPPKIAVEQENVAAGSGYHRATYTLSNASHYVLLEARALEDVLVTAVSVTSVAVWKTQDTATRALLQSMILDGDAIRAELDAQHSLPANLETLTLGGEIEFLPADERKQLRRQRQAPLQLNATFAEMDLLRPFTLVVRKGDAVIGRVNAEWSMLVDFSRDFGIVRSIEDGMQVRLRYWPPLPLTPGDDYAADLYYDNRLLATHAFRVEEVKPPAQPVVVRFWVAPDPQHENHIPKSRLYAPSDMLSAFLDADYPAGALARIFWSGPGGLIVDSIHSTYVPLAAHHQVDAHIYRPAAGWAPGDYLVTAQINGDRWAEKDFTIVEPAAAPVESDLVAALQLPATVSETIALETLAGGKLRLKVAGPPPADPSYLLTDETVTLWDARLRQQGWLRAPAGPAAAGKGRTYAWSKDGDTLVATLSAVRVDETRQHFTLAVAYLEAGTADAPPRAALVPITRDNLDRLAPVIGAGQPA